MQLLRRRIEAVELFVLEIRVVDHMDERLRFPDNFRRLSIMTFT
jgi:hypothetical protein